MASGLLGVLQGLECPHCRTRVAAGEANCGQCGRGLLDEAGERLRPIDVAFDMAEFDALAQRRSAWGAGLGLFWGLVSLLPLTLLIVPPALVVSHLLFPRLAIALPVRRWLSPSRRFITGWVSRMALVASATLYGFGGLPFVALAAGPIGIGGACLLEWIYLRYHLRAEQSRKAISDFERIVLLMLVLLVTAIFAVLAAILATGAVAWEAIVG